MHENEIRLRENSYPGRGIVIGKTPDGKNLVQVYWIMGRSENSRNRIFVREGDSVKTKAYIESKMTDPSLVIYYPMRTLGNNHIITNGDQTDTIADFLAENKTFEEALLTRQFEPDQPNCTPRISGIIYFDAVHPSFSLSILKTVNNNDKIQNKEFYTYDEFENGIGKCIHTYMGDGNPLPSFDAHPYTVTLENDIGATAEKYWSLLNTDNRVSLLVKFIDAATGAFDIRIINRFN